MNVNKHINLPELAIAVDLLDVKLEASCSDILFV
jgi:hypothetical protein